MQSLKHAFIAPTLAQDPPNKQPHIKAPRDKTESVRMYSTVQCSRELICLALLKAPRTMCLMKRSLGRLQDRSLHPRARVMS